MTNPEFVFELNHSNMAVQARIESTSPDGPCITLNNYRILLDKPDEAREELFRFLKDFMGSFRCKDPETCTITDKLFEK